MDNIIYLYPKDDKEEFVLTHIPIKPELAGDNPLCDDNLPKTGLSWLRGEDE